MPYWNWSIDLQSDQLTGFYMKRICTESYFRTDYSTGFSKYMLIFKKQSNIDYLKIFIGLTFPFRLNSSKWKASYWLKCYVNCYTCFNCLLFLTNFLILAFNVGYMQLEIVLTLFPCHLRLVTKISYFQ